MTKRDAIICPNCGAMNGERDCDIRQQNSTPNISPSLTEAVEWKCKYCDMWFEAGSGQESSL